MISWAFGFSLDKCKNEDVLDLLGKVVKHFRLLKKDGFSPTISRRVGNTGKHNTIKYDIRICYNNSVRQKDTLLFKENILPFIKHEDKINRFKEMIDIVTKKSSVKEKTVKKSAPKKSVVLDEKLIPVVNICTVGH